MIHWLRSDLEMMRGGDNLTANGWREAVDGTLIKAWASMKASNRRMALYSPLGRPSIPPEKLLRTMPLQAFYSIRSERLLMERLEYDLLFRWFVGIGLDDPAWDHSVFSKNRDRLLEGDIAAKFLSAVSAQPKVKKLLSSDHFSAASGAMPKPTSTARRGLTTRMPRPPIRT